MSAQTVSNTLRQQQTEDTRARILDAAVDLLTTETNPALTHDDIAEHSGIARRTIYRYFPSRVELFDAIWKETDSRIALGGYPQTEGELLSAVDEIYSKMDENAGLMRGLLHSNAGLEMRRKDQNRRRAGIEKALTPATAHLASLQRRQAIAVFQILFSGPTWEMLRERGGLGAGEVAPAVRWALSALLETLHKDQARLKRADTAATDGKAIIRRDVAMRSKPISKRKQPL
jgi:AcrR family transcriptional regulator